MAILRSDVETALDEILSNEEGMRFQGLAVVVGKKRWPELIARQRKKDFGMDAYAAASLTPEKYGKGLAASITPTLTKIRNDASRAKENFPDLKALLFVTLGKVGNTTQKEWQENIQKGHGVELHIIEREEIITQMMMPENKSLCASFLYLNVDAEPEVADLIDRTTRAAAVVTKSWAAKTGGYPLVELAAVRLNPNGTESAELLSLEKIDQALSQSWRIVLEGPAGRGKTTTLIQLAQRARRARIPFMVDLAAWATSRRGILQYIAGMPAFQAEGLTPTDLARVQRTEPFVLLLNGWNEITESSSAEANVALRELERDFSSAGIIVATRAHHLTPPLPGALRLRLLRLGRVQRAAYLAARLGSKGAELRARIDADPSIDELTRTPFVLSEVAMLFEAGSAIPSTKMGVVAQVLHLHEQRDEHRNALQVAPMFGLQLDYLKALATEMSRRGAVSLSEADARAVVAGVARELVDRGQIAIAETPAVLATLAAHHILERVEYPETVFRFEHQQLQEYCAALDVRAQLVEQREGDREATDRFVADYVNTPVWAEPLRMIAETFGEQTGDEEADKVHLRAGAKLVDMALAVDLVFAGELAQHCGTGVWNEVRAEVGERLRAAYAIFDGSYKQYAMAAMLATGADDFRDIMLPLLSGENQQARLGTYRLWPDIRVSSLGSNWREQVRGWSEEARADFVSEVLHHRMDDEIVSFAIEDNSVAVKEAAISGLMWIGSDEELTRVLESMYPNAFEEVARNKVDRMPRALRPRVIVAMRNFVDSTSDNAARLRTALNLIESGENGLDDVVKDTMAELAGGDLRDLFSHCIRPALEYMRDRDPAWTSEWVVYQIAQGVPYGENEWLPFATVIPEELIETYVDRLETENVNPPHLRGMISVIAKWADAELAGRVFTGIRELRGEVDAEPDQRHEFEWQIISQLEALFGDLRNNIAVDGILASVASDDALDVNVATKLLTAGGRLVAEPLGIPEELRERLRAYLKGSVDVVLGQDDFDGREKANLALSIAQVGGPEDMPELLRLIHADIERMRRGRTALAGGDHGPLGNGGRTHCAGSHIAAVVRLDAEGAGQVLIELLREAEYCSYAAAAMAREFAPIPERCFDRQFQYELIWAARETDTAPSGDEQRRRPFASALNAELERLREHDNDGYPAGTLKRLASALAAIDGRDSATTVLDAIATPGRWEEYTCLEAAQRLLMGGVVLPATTVFALVDAILERTQRWMSDSDRHLVCSALALCPFVDDPAAGIDKMRAVISERGLRGYEHRELLVALGESRSDDAVYFLCELGSDAATLRQCEEEFFNAVAVLDTPRAREVLLGFVDPDIDGITLTRRPEREDLLVAQLAELGKRRPEVAERLQELCERDLPELNRQILSRVLCGIGSREALFANLNLIDDTRRPPIPQGVRDQLEGTFLEQEPYGEDPNTFTLHPRASNELRARLLGIGYEDKTRRKSAFMLLGLLEVWRLEDGRPKDELHHPDLASGYAWPPVGVVSVG